MAKIFSIIKKDISLYFSSPIALIFYIVLPIVFTVVLSATTGGFSNQTINFNYVDQANTPLSASLLAVLGDKDDLLLEAIDLTEAQSDFDEGKLGAYLVIPTDFSSETLIEDKLSVQLFQQPNRTSSQTIYQMLRLALTKVAGTQAKTQFVIQTYQTLHPEVNPVELEHLADQLAAEIQLEIAEAPSRLTETVSQMGEDIVYDPTTSSSAGQLVTWVFIALVSLSGSMAFERQQGTLRRLLVSPTSRLTYFVATILGAVLIAMVQVTLLMTFGALVLDAPWLDRPLPTFLLLLVFTFAAGGLGAFLGSLVRTEGQASGISTAVGMIFALLSGAWFPIELFPKVMQNVAKIFPTYWAVQGLKDILIINKPMMDILPTIGILMGFAVLFLSLGLAFFKTE